MKLNMKLNTFSDPFYRTVAHAFLGSLFGLVGGIVLGAIMALIARYGDAGSYAGAVSYLSVGSMTVGTVLGAVLGGIVGIVRKD
jgi:MFS family permease